MENRDEKSKLILSDVIKSRCHLSSTLLYYTEYENMLSEDLKLSNIIYCDIRNIHESSIRGDTKLTVFIEFDLLMIYESISPDNISEYHFHSEKICRNLNIDASLYSEQYPVNTTKNLRYRNLIKDIHCSANIDISCKKIIINITASIDSLLLSEDVIELPNSSIQIKDECRKCDDEFIAVDEQTEVNVEEGLNQYINQLSSLLKKASKIQNDNKRLSDECEEKDKRISYLEYKYVLAEQECNNLHQQEKQKSIIIQGLKSNLGNYEKSAAELQDTCLTVSEELKSLKKENADLKALLAEEKSRKKSQLNYKIKSVINKLII